MSAITRGHSYDITDVVNAESLNNLVRLAVISGLTASDIPGSGAQISVFSAPTNAGNGWISAQYELPFLSSNVSWSEFNYVISTPEGQVSLFKPLGLESRRFFNFWGANGGPGTAWLILGQGATSSTLQATAAYTTGFSQHSVLGAARGTAASGFPARLVLKGLHDGDVVDAGGTDVRHYWYLINAVTAQFQHTAGATNTDKVISISMDHRLTGAALIPGYLFGAPCWRSP